MYKIGDFSRLCQVSVKTLHHYDDVGLVRPARVDRETGYRFYEAAQVAQALDGHALPPLVHLNARTPLYPIIARKPCRPAKGPARVSTTGWGP